MNLAEQILRRKHAAMYSRPHEPPAPEPVRLVATPTPPQSARPPSPAPTASGQNTYDDVVLTPDGRIRRAPRTSNRTAPMSGINVDLDL